MAYFLFTRRWTTCRFAAIMSLAILDVAIIGMRVAHVDWIAGWSNSIAATGVPGGVNDYGWAGTFRDEMMDLKMLLIGLPLSHRALRIAIMGVTLAMLATYFRSFPRRDQRTPHDELLPLATLCAISLLPIYHRVYDAALLTTGLAWILSELDGPRRKLALAMLVPMLAFLIPFDLVLSISNRVPALTAMARTDWWQSLIAPHYAWGLLGVTLTLLFVMKRQAATQRVGEAAVSNLFQQRGDEAGVRSTTG
jgi:hypothetical protein